MNESNFNNLREIARKQYNDANCKYDNMEYIYHIDMVISVLNKYHNVYKKSIDINDTIIASLYHDSIEDAKQTYANIFDVAGKEIADIVLAVTDVPAENRLMKHLLTMGKTVKDYRAIILKMCDILANTKYSKSHCDSMFNKYYKEYSYRKPIFQQALVWYKKYLNEDILKLMWEELDEIYKKI